MIVSIFLLLFKCVISLALNDITTSFECSIFCLNVSQQAMQKRCSTIRRSFESEKNCSLLWRKAGNILGRGNVGLFLGTILLGYFQVHV